MCVLLLGSGLALPGQVLRRFTGAQVVGDAGLSLCRSSNFAFEISILMQVLPCPQSNVKFRQMDMTCHIRMALSLVTRCTLVDAVGAYARRPCLAALAGASSQKSIPKGLQGRVPIGPRRVCEVLKWVLLYPGGRRSTWATYHPRGVPSAFMQCTWEATEDPSTT